LEKGKGKKDQGEKTGGFNKKRAWGSKDHSAVKKKETRVCTLENKGEMKKSKRGKCLTVTYAFQTEARTNTCKCVCEETKRDLQLSKKGFGQRATEKKKTIEKKEVFTSGREKKGNRVS